MVNNYYFPYCGTCYCRTVKDPAGLCLQTSSIIPTDWCAPFRIAGYLAAMKKLLTILAFFAALSLKAQTVINLASLTSHIGDSVTVKGKIFGARYLESAKNTPTFISVGGAFPNQLLTIVIWGDVRKTLGYAPEEMPYVNGMVKISGRVELYKGKPQMVVTNPSQLTILYDEEVPASPLPPIEKKN